MNTRLSSLAKGTAIYGVGQTLNRMVALLMLPLFTAYLSPEDFGVIALLGILSFLVTPLFGLGFGASMGIVYFEGSCETRKARTVWTALAILVASSAIMLSVAAMYAEPISLLLFNNPQYGREILLVVGTAALNGIMIQPLQSRLQFEEQAGLFTVLSTVSALLVLALNALFVIRMGMGVDGWLIGGAIGAAVSFGSFFLVVARSTPFKLDYSVARELVRLGLPIIPSFAFLLVMQHSGRYMLQWEKGLAEVGIYTIGYNFGMLAALAVGAFTTAWYSYFNSFIDRQGEGAQAFSKVMTYYIFLSGIIGLLFFAAAKPVVLLFTQSAFHSAYGVIGMVALSQCLSGLFSVLLPGCYFAREVRVVNIVQGVATVALLSANLLLIPRYGMYGAAGGMLFGFLVMPLAQLWINRRRNYLRIEYETRRILLFTIEFALFTALACSLYTIGNLLYYLLACAGVILVFILFVIRLLTVDERNAIRDRLGSLRSLRG